MGDEAVTDGARSWGPTEQPGRLGLHPEVTQGLEGEVTGGGGGLGGLVWWKGVCGAWRRRGCWSVGSDRALLTVLAGQGSQCPGGRGGA